MERHIMFMNWNNQHSKGFYYMMCLLCKKSLNYIILQQKNDIKNFEYEEEKKNR